MSVCQSVYLSVRLFLPHSPTFPSGVLHQCAAETFYDVHLYVLNPSREKREGEGKQHLHQIMGRLRMGHEQPPTQWDLDIGSLGRADSSKKSGCFVGKNKRCVRGWDMGGGRGDEFRGGVLYLY